MRKGGKQKMAINEQVNRYAHLDPSQYPVVREQILERRSSLQKAMDEVKKVLDDQIEKLQEQLNITNKDLDYINGKLSQ